MRRRAHRERVEQEAELLALLLGRQVEERERARLQVGLVDPERPAAELVAVADQVVRVRDRVRGILVEAVDPFGAGRVNGWCFAP